MVERNRHGDGVVGVLEQAGGVGQRDGEIAGAVLVDRRRRGGDDRLIGDGVTVSEAVVEPSVESAVPSWAWAETPIATEPSNSLAGVMVRPARSAVEVAVIVKVPL